MKIGDKVVISNDRCFGGRTGTIVGDCIPDSQLYMLTGIAVWKVKFDEPFDSEYGTVTEFEYSEGSLTLIN